MVSVMLMNGFLRVLLIVCALIVLAFMIRRVKKSEIHAADTVFWFLLIACFLLIALVPQIAYFLSDLIGFESPSNLVFLFVVAVLFLREFISTLEIAKLREKLYTLTQEIALVEHENDEEDQ